MVEPPLVLAAGMLVGFHFRAGSLFAHGANAESDLLFFRIHLHDLEIVLLSGFESHGLAVGILRLGVVAEAFDAFGDLDKCPEAGYAQNLAVQHVSDVMLR